VIPREATNCMPLASAKLRWTVIMVIAFVWLSRCPGALAQETATSNSTPAGQVGTLTITRYSCTGDPAQTRIDKVPLGTPTNLASATPGACRLTGGDFTLLWDSGRRAQVFTVPADGNGSFADIKVTGEDSKPPRLVDSASSASLSVELRPNGVTSVISWEFIAAEPTEVPSPTMPPFPTVPPMPTMAPFPTMPPFPTFPPDMEAGAGEDTGNGSDPPPGDNGEGTTYRTETSDTARQLGFLLLAAGAFAGIQIYKHRSRKKAPNKDGRKPKQ
jgi:hypothetical protein